MQPIPIVLDPNAVEFQVNEYDCTTCKRPHRDLIDPEYSAHFLARFSSVRRRPARLADHFALMMEVNDPKPLR